MTISEQQLVCTRPFEWFEIHPDGNAFLCCPAWLRRPIGNLMQQNIDDIWNGPVAREIRKSIINGSFHNCSPKRCPMLAGKSGPAQPLGTVATPATAMAIKQQNATLTARPRHLNLCFDQSCNLACPTCRRENHRPTDVEEERIRQIKEIIEQELLPHAEALTLSGYGDPFAAQSYFGILKQLNRENTPRLQSVYLHTNGQLLTADLWQQLPNLHQLVKKVEISLDAASEKSYRQNRPGGSFERVLANLKFLEGLPLRRVISMVVQANNWQEIPQFFALGEKYAAAVYLSPLVNWGTFDKQEYLRRAVHLSGHPEFSQFNTLLKEYSQHPLLEPTALLQDTHSS